MVRHSDRVPCRPDRRGRTRSYRPACCHPDSTPASHGFDRVPTSGWHDEERISPIAAIGNEHHPQSIRRPAALRRAFALAGEHPLIGPVSIGDPDLAAAVAFLRFGSRSSEQQAGPIGGHLRIARRDDVVGDLLRSERD